MTTLMGDVRYAWRSLRQAPVFTTVAVLSIALAIGANAAIFTLVDQVLLRMLPVKDPARLVRVQGAGKGHYGSNYGGGNQLSYPMYEDFRDHNEVFDGMFCRYAFPVQIGSASGTERVSAEIVSGTYFPVLGVRPALGRLFGPEDDRAPGAAPYAVLSHGYWSSRFKRDPNILGKKLTINNQPLTIVGVAQEGFSGMDVGEPIQVFVPIAMRAQMVPTLSGAERREPARAVGPRVRPAEAGNHRGAGGAVAAAVLSARSSRRKSRKRRSRERPRTRRRSSCGHASRSSPAGRAGRTSRETLTKPLWVLMALVGGVLLIACANVANLQVARGAARQREIAIRLAFGAGRWRIVRHLLVESFMIALAGGRHRSADRHRLDRAAACAARALRRANRLDDDRSADRRRRVCGDGHHGNLVRPRARTADDASAACADAEGRVRQCGGRQRRGAAAQGARGRAGVALAADVDWRGPVRAQHQSSDDRRSRLPHVAARLVFDRSVPEWIRRRAGARTVPRFAGASARHSRRR